MSTLIGKAAEKPAIYFEVADPPSRGLTENDKGSGLDLIRLDLKKRDIVIRPVALRPDNCAQEILTGLSELGILE